MINSDYDYTEDEVIGSDIFVYEFVTLCHELIGIISMLCWVMLQFKIHTSMILGGPLWSFYHPRATFISLKNNDPVMR
jgi:hypothetical protein